LAGCGKSSSEKDGNALLATVDGHKIFEEDARQFAALFLLEQYNYPLDQFPESEREEIVNRSILNIMIDDWLIREQMKEADVITKDVQNQIKEGITSIKQDETIGPSITSLKITDEAIEDYFKYSFYMRAYMDKINEETPVTNGEVQAYYDKNKDDASLASVFKTAPSVKVSHILIKDEEHTAAKKAEAEKILKEAKDGADFAELAKKYSEDDGSKESGGDVGEVTNNGQMVQAFQDAALALTKNGELSDIVETEYGFHILKATSNPVAEKAKTLEEAKDDIIKYIQSDNLAIEVEKLREKAKITYDKGLPPTDESESGSEAEAAADESAADKPAGEEPASEG
jgi:parvulin-like peptidyl-prolyl isomerase